jgi:hypothetical protein
MSPQTDSLTVAARKHTVRYRATTVREWSRTPKRLRPFSTYSKLWGRLQEFGVSALQTESLRHVGSCEVISSIPQWSSSVCAP